MSQQPKVSGLHPYRIHLLTSLSEVTQHDVRLALAEEDTTYFQREDATPVYDDVTPGILISSGIELEAQQYVLISPRLFT